MLVRDCSDTQREREREKDTKKFEYKMRYVSAGVVGGGYVGTGQGNWEQYDNGQILRQQ